MPLEAQGQPRVENPVSIQEKPRVISQDMAYVQDHFGTKRNSRLTVVLKRLTYIKLARYGMI